MRTAAVALLAALVALSAGAGTITSLNPSSFRVNEGESFLRINGSGLGGTVQYIGSAGTFNITINASDATSVTTWVPLQVLAKPGRYSVSVLGGTGNSAPVWLDVIDPDRSRFQLVFSEALIYEGLSREGTGVKYNVSTMGGLDDPAPVIKCDPPSGWMMKIGVTKVRCEASNRFGETDSGEFAIMVYDAPPLISVPSKVSVETEKDGAYVDYRVTASDRIDGALQPSCSPASGSYFPLGKTNVQCSAFDSAKNVGTGTFVVEVVDLNKRLQIHLPASLNAEADSPEGARVEFNVTADGSGDPAPDIKCDPTSGSRFKFGPTTVYCSASDRFGNSAEGKFEVTVADTSGPVVASILSSPDWLSPSGSWVTVSVKIDPVDLVDPQPRCMITDVTANEPVDGEWKILSDTDVSLHADMGRVDRQYSINVSCSDRDDNRTTGSVSVLVSKEQPKGGNLATPAPVTGGRRRSAGGH